MMSNPQRINKNFKKKNEKRRKVALHVSLCYPTRHMSTIVGCYLKPGTLWNFDPEFHGLKGIHLPFVLW